MSKPDHVGRILGGDSADSDLELRTQLEEAERSPEKQLKNMVHPYFADELRKHFQRAKLPAAKTVDGCVAVSVNDAYWNGVEDVINFIAKLGEPS